VSASIKRYQYVKGCFSSGRIFAKAGVRKNSNFRTVFAIIVENGLFDNKMIHDRQTLSVIIGGAAESCLKIPAAVENTVNHYFVVHDVD